jgi:hypothetical protein
MQMKVEFIHNSGLTITEFYVEKLVLVMGAGIAAVFCYYNYIDNNPFWIACVFMGAALLFVSDAHAMAIGHNGTRLILHHLWRQSSLEVTEARFLWLSGGGNRLMRRSGVELLVAIGNRPWQLYFVGCDRKNNLAALLDEFQIR